MAASARLGSDCSDAVTRSTPSRRRGGQMPSVADAVGGSISPPIAWQQHPGAPSTRRTTSRPTTDAPSRDARWVRATRAHTGGPSARIAGEPMGRGRMPVLPRERPACSPGDGGHHPLHAGREGPRRGSSPARRVWRSRRPGGETSRCFLFFLFVFLLFFCLVDMGRRG